MRHTSDIQGIQMTRCWLSETHIAITPEGKIKPCTRYKDTQNSPNINQEQIKDVFFGEYLSIPREQLKNNSFPDACSKCASQERNGIQSMRQLFNMNADFGSLNGTSSDIRSFEIAFSNHCNYRCRHCNSFSSAKWKSEDELLGRHTPDTMLLEPNIENLDINNLDNLENIKILGGEPLINKSHTRFMRELSKRDCSNISLEYFTNGSVFPSEEVVSVWKQMKYVSVSISLDDIGKYFDYFRTDADFYGTVEQNCFAYDALSTEFNVKPHFHIVINVLNMYRLDRIVDYIFENFPTWRFTVDTVINPSWLKISQWSKAEADNMIMHLKMKKYNTNITRNKNMIDYMCRILASNCTKETSDFSDLVKYNTILDKSRNTSLIDIHPYIGKNL